jgi:hypothetical protein
MLYFSIEKFSGSKVQRFRVQRFSASKVQNPEPRTQNPEP